MLKKYLQPLTSQEVNDLIQKYPLFNNIEPDKDPWWSQYDTLSSQLNYAFVRDFKPKVVVEFGTRGGRCTHDILKGLLDNGGEYILKPYEIDNKPGGSCDPSGLGWRDVAQRNLKNAYGDKAPIIGGDIVSAQDVPDNIDYLFVDNSHDYLTTQWVFDHLLPEKCLDGALVHFHDLVIYGDYKFQATVTPKENEIAYFQELIDKSKLPLKKILWGWESGIPMVSSTWWHYAKN